MALSESLFRARFGARMKPFDGIPGPTPRFPFGTARDFLGANPWDVCAGYEKKYGGLTLIWEGGKPVLVLNDAELIREVLITKPQDYWKDAPSPAFRPVLKKTEFNENFDEWRVLAQNDPLNMEGYLHWLSTQVPVVQKVVDEHLDRLTAAAGPVNLLPVVERMVYDALNACMVGDDWRRLTDDHYRAFYRTSDMATKRMKQAMLVPLIPPIDPRFYIARSKHFGTFEQLIREARKDSRADANDMLHVFLRKGTNVPDDQLAMYLGNIHAAGVFSVGTGVVNTFYLLARHPEVATRLHAELTDSIRKDPGDPSALTRCRYQEQVLHESLRFYPPVPFFFRNVVKTKSTQLGRYTLPPNTIVYIVAQGVQRSARYWKDPDRFDPDRWDNGPVPVDALDHDIFLPFGRGPRICSGATLAMLCMKVIVGSVYSRRTVKIDPSIEMEQFFHCGVAEPKNVVGAVVPRG
jgi:cytochrome P450